MQCLYEMFKSNITISQPPHIHNKHNKTLKISLHISSVITFPFENRSNIFREIKIGWIPYTKWPTRRYPLVTFHVFSDQSEGTVLIPLWPKSWVQRYPRLTLPRKHSNISNHSNINTFDFKRGLSTQNPHLLTYECNSSQMPSE